MKFFNSHFVFQVVIYKPDARLKKGFQSMKKKPELLDDWSSLTNQGEFCFLFCGTQMYITSSLRFLLNFVFCGLSLTGILIRFCADGCVMTPLNSYFCEIVLLIPSWVMSEWAKMALPANALMALMLHMNRNQRVYKMGVDCQIIFFLYRLMVYFHRNFAHLWKGGMK